jgi:hypothetical protein
MRFLQVTKHGRQCPPPSQAQCAESYGCVVGDDTQRRVGPGPDQVALGVIGFFVMCFFIIGAG